MLNISIGYIEVQINVNIFNFTANNFLKIHIFYMYIGERSPVFFARFTRSKKLKKTKLKENKQNFKAFFL
jgi:hypothetical protein